MLSIILVACHTRNSTYLARLEIVHLMKSTRKDFDLWWLKELLKWAERLKQR